MVKIYSITATNAVDGVASSCRACALGSERSGSSCVPCPPGHYIEKETNQCQECPPDTYLSVHQVYGKEACIACGPGSKSTQVGECVLPAALGEHMGAEAVLPCVSPEARRLLSVLKKHISLQFPVSFLNIY